MCCPKCGQLRFVPYVLAADGQTLAGDEFGRCDREQNCGYQRYPSDIEAPNVTPVIAKPKQPLRFYQCAINWDVKTPLFDYVARLVGVSNAIAIWRRYQIGRDGERTVFWQIAIDGSIRAGKSIPYGIDGHRIKTDEHPANWLHKCRAWKDYFHGEELQQCYFGEHLLRLHADKPVVIVESEKTAAILSQYSQGFVWLASGGSQNIKNETKNAVLNGRKVLLIPDHGQYWNWAQVAHKYGWEITDAIEKEPVFEGCDILDILEAGLLGKELLKHINNYETLRNKEASF